MGTTSLSSFLDLQFRFLMGSIQVINLEFVQIFLCCKSVSDVLSRPLHSRIKSCVFKIKSMVPLSVFVFQLPVIIDLRNPTLKARHWAAIEHTVDATLLDLETPLTLERLSELHVFDFAQEIQDISGQASGESSLEIILKKVNMKNIYLSDQVRKGFHITNFWVI